MRPEFRAPALVGASLGWASLAQSAIAWLEVASSNAFLDLAQFLEAQQKRPTATDTVANGALTVMRAIEAQFPVVQ